jgi:hypothetical protein
MKNKIRQEEIKSFIERSVFWEGELSVKYLADNFNLSLKNAEEYIADYINLKPENIKNRTVKDKIYPDDNNFKFEYSENNYHNILRTLSTNSIPFFETLPILQPVFDRDLLRDIIRSMNRRDNVLNIRYQSLNSSVPEERKIIPYSIYYVRGRYHIRAYCLAKNAFRDFVLSRIISIIHIASYKGEQITDIESSEYISVIVKPHSDLSDMQKMSTEIEFGMDNGQKEIKVKKSLLIYLLDELRIGKEYYKPPFTVLELVNKEDVNTVLSI